MTATHGKGVGRPNRSLIVHNSGVSVSSWAQLGWQCMSAQLHGKKLAASSVSLSAIAPCQFSGLLLSCSRHTDAQDGADWLTLLARCPSTWTAAQVELWVCVPADEYGAGCAALASRFRRTCIDGSLLMQLTSDDLRAHLHITEVAERDQLLEVRACGLEVLIVVRHNSLPLQPTFTKQRSEPSLQARERLRQLRSRIDSGELDIEAAIQAEFMEQESIAAEHRRRHRKDRRRDLQLPLHLPVPANVVRGVGGTPYAAPPAHVASSYRSCSGSVVPVCSKGFRASQGMAPAAKPGCLAAEQFLVCAEPF